MRASLVPLLLLPLAAHAQAPAASWLPRGTALVQALDKVDARATVLSIPVGRAAGFGALTIAVQACVVRPADQPQDAAAYLTVVDPHLAAGGAQGGPGGFRGWMLASAPQASLLEDPVYDLRVIACR